jgi:hypothetical protein
MYVYIHIYKHLLDILASEQTGIHKFKYIYLHLYIYKSIFDEKNMCIYVQEIT